MTRAKARGHWWSSPVVLARYLVGRLIQDRAPEMAAALAYRTIFSLIPVLVIALVLVKAFAGPEGIRVGFGKLMEYSGLQSIALNAPGGDPGVEGAAPGGEGGAASNETAAQLTQWIERFVNNAVERITGLNYGAITIVGAVLLIYSAISLLISVEQAFNTICRAAAGRRLGVRLTTYWTLLTLGSLALIGSFAITEWYARQLQSMPAWAAWTTKPLQFAATVGITWLLLILAYTRMPNARVKVGPAAIGAFVGAVLWEFMKGGLSTFVRNMTNGQVAIYGTLALVPLFVLWVYVTWLIVILGLEIACAAQSAGSGRLAGRLLRISAGRLIDPNSAALLARAIARDFRDGRQPSVQDLALRTKLPESIVQPMVDQMVVAGILLRVQGGADETVVTLARPPEVVKLSDVMSAIENLYEQSADEGLLTSLREQQMGALKSKTLADLLQADEAPIRSTAPAGKTKAAAAGAT